MASIELGQIGQPLSHPWQIVFDGAGSHDELRLLVAACPPAKTVCITWVEASYDPKDHEIGTMTVARACGEC